MKIPVMCYKCNKKMKKENFDIVLGTFAAFLCDKCFKKIEKLLGVDY